MHAVWVKIDETLPWIELKGTYSSKKDARRATEDIFRDIQMKIVPVEDKARKVKALLTAK